MASKAWSWGKPARVGVDLAFFLRNSEVVAAVRPTTADGGATAPPRVSLHSIRQQANSGAARMQGSPTTAHGRWDLAAAARATAKRRANSMIENRQRSEREATQRREQTAHHGSAPCSGERDYTNEQAREVRERRHDCGATRDDKRPIAPPRPGRTSSPLARALHTN